MYNKKISILSREESTPHKRYLEVHMHHCRKEEKKLIFDDTEKKNTEEQRSK